MADSWKLKYLSFNSAFLFCTVILWGALAVLSTHHGLVEDQGSLDEFGNISDVTLVPWADARQISGVTSVPDIYALLQPDSVESKIEFIQHRNFIWNKNTIFKSHELFYSWILVNLSEVYMNFFFYSILQ